MTPYRKRGERPPSRDFVRDLRTEVEGWVQDGLVGAEQAEAILARYADVTVSPGVAPSVSVVSAALYATAGILIGASSVALVYVEHEWRDSIGALLGAAAVLAGAAALLRFSRPGAWLLADAGFVGALVPLSFAPSVQDRETWASIAALVLPLALVVWRRGSPFVVPLGVVAASIGAVFTANAFFSDAPRSAHAACVVIQLALVAGVVAFDRFLQKKESTAAGALAVIAAALSLLVYFAANLNDPGSTTVEIELGIAMLAMTLAGGMARHRGVVTGAGVVLAVDAIVFAFDVGGALTGTIALAAAAALLIWQAEFLRRYFRKNR